MLHLTMAEISLSGAMKDMAAHLQSDFRIFLMKTLKPAKE
jgi:hypothetical protein